MALQRIIGRLCSTIEGICAFGPLPPDLHACAPEQAERAERALAALHARAAEAERDAELGRALRSVAAGLAYGERLHVKQLPSDEYDVGIQRVVGRIEDTEPTSHISALLNARAALHPAGETSR